LVSRLSKKNAFILSDQLRVMDKDQEREFLEVYSKALVSLPFDVKVLLEAVADADLEHAVRELAAAAVVHIIAPKDGNVDRPLRHAEDVVLLRLALRKILAEGGEGAEAFQSRFDENYGRLDQEIGVFESIFGGDVVSWLDAKWPALAKVVYVRKKIPQFVDDEEQGTFLYDEGLRFMTEYPLTEKSLAGRVKQAQPIVDHLQRKREQDRKKISAP
jgi:acyl-CoA hydrolase